MVGMLPEKNMCAFKPSSAAMEFWGTAGQLFAMPTDDRVEAALVGFDQGEVVAIPFTVGRCRLAGQ
jgi:hypothetical protein